MDKNDILDYVTETPGNTNRAVLGSMLDSVNSGSSLPSVTSDDNGKVLAVVEGVWDKAEASGSDFYKVVIMPGETFTADKTFDEIKQAWTNGKLILFGLSGGGYAFANPTFQSPDFNNPTSFAAFFVSTFTVNTMSGYMIYYSANGTINLIDGNIS